MEVVERKRSRGGFLNLFDWPGKSRKKKLSSSGSLELSEEPKRTKQNAQNLLKPSLLSFLNTIITSVYVKGLFVSSSVLFRVLFSVI